MSDVESMLLPICVPGNAPEIRAIVRRLQGRIAELEAENAKLRWLWFRTSDYMTRSLDGLPPPPIDTGSEG
jgi:hypothetical protein